jgi:hypothetical protein
VRTLLPINLTFQEQTEMLDRLYATPKNRRIPIYWAIGLCKLDRFRLVGRVPTQRSQAASRSEFATSINQCRSVILSIQDGDTLQVLHDGQTVRIQLHGIDCPERRPAFGTRARQATGELAFGRQVKVIVREVDRYGGLVADIGPSLLPMADLTDRLSGSSELVCPGSRGFGRASMWQPERNSVKLFTRSPARATKVSAGNKGFRRSRQLACCK